MKMLVTMFTDDKEINTAEKMHEETCRRFIENKEGFNMIYNEVVDASSEYKNHLKAATIKGTVIGATAVCLIGVGVLGYNKISKYRKLKKINKGEEA